MVTANIGMLMPKEKKIDANKRKVQNLLVVRIYCLRWEIEEHVAERGQFYLFCFLMILV